MESGEDVPSSVASIATSCPQGNPSATFAQNVRSELETLAAKSMAADASTWANKSNTLLAESKQTTTGAPSDSQRRRMSAPSVMNEGSEPLPAISPPLQEMVAPQGKEVGMQTMTECIPVVGKNEGSRVIAHGSSPEIVSSRAALPIQPSVNLHHQPVIGQALCQMPGQSSSANIVNITPSKRLDDLEGVEQLMPQFVRRRSAPAAHQVITDEVDAEMYESKPVEISDMRELASLLKAEKDDSKGEPRTRLNELSTFALCGFGQFDAKLAIGVYNKERDDLLCKDKD